MILDDGGLYKACYSNKYLKNRVKESLKKKNIKTI